MSYASRDDALARAGRYAGVFQVAGKRPDEADLDRVLADVSSVVDAEIRSRGYDPATLTDELEAALVDVAAWAALVRLLPAAAPGDENVDELVERGREILRGYGFPSLAEGGTDVFAALAALEAGVGGAGGASAGSLWDELELPADDRPADEIGEASEPVFRRGMTL